MAEPRELTVVAEQLLAPVPGGTGRYTAELLRALAATAPDGWSVASVVAWHRDVEAARVEGVRGPRRLPLPRRALVAAWQQGAPVWRGLRGRAVHAPTPLAPPRAGTLSVTVHDTVPWTHPETLTSRGVRWHRAMIERAARTADALVVPTRAVADELAEHVDPTTAVHVVGHGVTALPDSVGAGAPDLPERYVLAIGTLEPRKGIDVLVRAMAELAESPESPESPVPLLLVGQPGWGGLDPVALGREQGVPDGRVRELGRLSDAQLAAVLRGASVLAVPSLAEGFGLPLLEAMAAGVPVVHSDVPALVEIANGAGVVVPRGDAHALAGALKIVLASGARAAELAERGRARAREFTWTSAAEAVWRLHSRTG